MGHFQAFGRAAYPACSMVYANNVVGIISTAVCIAWFAGTLLPLHCPVVIKICK